jgi:hypothetical protein
MIAKMSDCGRSFKAERAGLWRGENGGEKNPRLVFSVASAVEVEVGWNSRSSKI